MTAVQSTPATTAPIQLFNLADHRRRRIAVEAEIKAAELAIEETRARRTHEIEQAAARPLDQRVSHLNAAASFADELAGLENLLAFRKDALALIDTEIATYRTPARLSRAAQQRDEAGRQRALALAELTKFDEALAVARDTALRMFGHVNAMRAQLGIGAVALGPMSSDGGEQLRGLVSVMIERAFAGTESRHARRGLEPPPDWKPSAYAESIVDYLRPGFIEGWE